jgi:hypothetical protein
MAIIEEWAQAIVNGDKQQIAIDYTQKPTTMSQNTPPNAQNAPINNANALKLVASTKKLLGHNLSEGTGVPYYVACAISVNKVHQDAFGFPIGGGASTADLYQALLTSKYFKQVDTPSPGCVVISPTGKGTKQAYPHGHVGLRGVYGICSNDSSTGLFSENYTDASWVQQFHDTEGYPVYYFQRI